MADGETDVDQCRLLAEYVADGGAFGLIGGYMSFAGKHGAAWYGFTAIDDVFPVTVARADDRAEASHGPRPRSIDALPGSPPSEWPSIPGHNPGGVDLVVRVWATVDGDPLLVVGDHGDGSAVAFMTDRAPHLAPEAFLE